MSDEGSGLRLGKRPAVRPAGLATLAAYAQGRLPHPPTTSPVPDVAAWGMLGNDRLGDCTIAGAAHLVIAADTEVDGVDHIPDTVEVTDTYLSLTGGADQGLAEYDVLHRWWTDGLFGARIDAYAPVDHRHIAEIQQAVAFYGAAYIGVALPASAQRQFAAGQPWVVDPDSPLVGGHCILLVGYGPQYVQAVTWGAVVDVSWPWLARYCDEAWAVIPHVFTEAGRGPVLDLASLRQDLGDLR